mmetsp:Transcript_54545/g.174955  ORF Transcript_54545/g.174955 Transcript_54545/m.174955 type:complete len:277 (-) Transcript_54545:118-948(-)
MCQVRELSPDDLFNFIAGPTLPVIFQVGEQSCRIRGSLQVPAEEAGDPGRWEERLLGLEGAGLLDSCTPVALCAEEGALRARALEAITHEAVCEAVLTLTMVHVLQAGGLAALHPLLLGEGPARSLPARVVAAPGLWLGDCDAAADRGVLAELNIRFVVNATEEVPNFFEQEDGQLRYLRVPLADLPEQQLAGHLEEAVLSIGEALQRGDAVLVHCLMGISRSASLVLAYLMRSQGLGYDAALAALRESRWSVRPNEGFRQQLRELEEEWRPPGTA